MAETESVKQETGTQTETEVKTFTQAEVDAIVQGRLAKESGKYEELKQKAAKFDEIEEANKSELQKANDKADALQKKLDAITKDNEIKAMRSRVAEEMKVPSNLLTADDEEGCKAQAQGILDFAKVKTPTVPDGGEVTPSGNKSTRDMFADAFNEALGSEK